MSKSVWHREMCKDEIILDALRKFMSDTTDDEDFAIACEAFRKSTQITPGITTSTKKKMKRNARKRQKPLLMR